MILSIDEIGFLKDGTQVRLTKAYTGMLLLDPHQRPVRVGETYPLFADSVVTIYECKISGQILYLDASEIRIPRYEPTEGSG